MIVLGCRNRSLKEWVDDFWNNEKEFPNNGCEQSMKRLYAFNVIRRSIRLQAFKDGSLNEELLELLNRKIEVKNENI